MLVVLVTGGCSSPGISSPEELARQFAAAYESEDKPDLSPYFSSGTVLKLRYWKARAKFDFVELFERMEAARPD